VVDVPERVGPASLALLPHALESAAARYPVWDGRRATAAQRAPRSSESQEPEAKERSAERDSTLQGLRLLVVDDDYDSRTLLKLVLEYYGAQVFTASAASSALSMLLETRPHAIISDIAMARHDGFWLLREVRKLPLEAGGSVPAIAITAYDYRYGARRCLRAGFRAYLRKPIDLGQLRTVVERLRP
jgi:CheY-like chemotaxis protein